MSQALYPVIMCGGSGTRLWPASRPDRPKQFLGLAGERSLFQDTVERVAPLAEEGGRLLIVTGVGHRRWVEDQLVDLGLSAVILLEPEARDSAAAMGAASAWIVANAPDAVAVFVASDHHMPNGEAFQAAARTASIKAAEGMIVMLGVRPTEPSSAYGYILPTADVLSPVKQFVEKPDRDTAIRYVADGYLWNSGNFIVKASVLLSELERFQPEVAEAARRGVDAPGNGVVKLSSEFRKAPKISIDHAVMELTDKTWVLPVDFAWSDLGAWDAVAATGTGSSGVWIGAEGDQCLVRAVDGVIVATAGVSNLAIIAEGDAVLVCDLSRAQEVKGLVDRIRAEHPHHFTGGTPVSLCDVATSFGDWMRSAALPVWSTLGVADDGGFHDKLQTNGRLSAVDRRARVQGRQVFAFSRAGALGWRGPWRRVAERGLERFWSTNGLENGAYRTLTDHQGAPADDAIKLYDQAFALLGMAHAVAMGVHETEARARGDALREWLLATRLDDGAWREAGDHPFQANAHMHLFEAALAWEDVTPDAFWVKTADAIAERALSRFIDPASGALREFFQSDWTAASGDDGRLVEPGHQFEWAWLLARWGDRRGRPEGRAAAQRLYRVGLHGVDHRRGVAMDGLNIDMATVAATARLWPQTEWIKAALLLAETAQGEDRAGFIHDATVAVRALQGYLLPNGLWRDRMRIDGDFVEEAAPASSLYHIMSAYDQLAASAKVLPELAGCDLSLG